MQPKPRVQNLSAVRLAVRPAAGHAEPYLASLRTPIGEIWPHDCWNIRGCRFNSASRYRRPACGSRFFQLDW